MNKTLAIKVICVVIALFASAPHVFAQKGEKSVGLTGGYTTVTESPAAGLYFQYSFSKHFRLGTNIDYYFRHKDIDGFALNIDAEIPFALTSDRFRIYPLAGFSLTSWNIKYHSVESEEESDDSSARKNRAGINVGGGIEYYVTPSLKLSLEGKYSYVPDFDGGVVGLSIGYVF